uniref:Uncharacterized protein n=2 Tax=Oryza rufipogon TaxID=4529 RepID=A0A0E0QJA6_ORYRU
MGQILISQPMIYQAEIPKENTQLNMSSPAQSGNKQKTYTSFGQSKKDISKRMAIELEAYAVKGMRKVHSKWSPVATTAWYRISLRLVKKCPLNIFDIGDQGNCNFCSH